MSRLIKLNEAVIVEGRYDKITLENIIEAVIIPTNGFGIFKDKAKCRLIRRIAEEKGIIIMTDSDSAGNLIRSHLKNICKGQNIINVYIPQLAGKEKRKSHRSKEGFLGVEGMSEEIITRALDRSGVTHRVGEKKAKEISKTDMYRLGLSGRDGSAEERRKLCAALELPENLSANALLDILNTFYTADEFERMVKGG